MKCLLEAKQLITHPHRDQICWYVRRVFHPRHKRGAALERPVVCKPSPMQTQCRKALYPTPTEGNRV